MSWVKQFGAALLEPLGSYHDLDRRLLHRRLSRHLGAGHVAVSAVASLYDSPGQPDQYLLGLSARLIEQCAQEALDILRERNAPKWVFNWPGEHYRVLAAAVALLQPKLVVEIGTSTGLSALAMQSRLPGGGRLVTFDLAPWDRTTAGIGKSDGTYLRPGDFGRGALHQELGDLSRAGVFARHAELLAGADLLFIDGPKDGAFEPALLERFRHGALKPGALAILDDIRLWNMLPVWRAVESPKLDFTSFGHYAGTGLIHWI